MYIRLGIHTLCFIRDKQRNCGLKAAYFEHTKQIFLFAELSFHKSTYYQHI